jgi:hypothetical protein
MTKKELADLCARAEALAERLNRIADYLEKHPPKPPNQPKPMRPSRLHLVADQDRRAA